MNRVPQVSVVMAAFNAEKYVGAAMESILAQTFTDFELIVVDDGSNDRTLEILRDNGDNRIRIISNDKNLGIPKTRNIGIAGACGRYIAWQDADDISLPERLQKQFEYMERHPKIAVLGTGRQTMSGDGNIKSHRPPMASPTFADMLKSNCLAAPSVMLRKKCLEEAGGYDDFFHQAEDYDLWLRLMKKYPVANLPETHCVIRRNIDSVTRRNQEALLLYRLLARNRAMGSISDESFIQIKQSGIESYYKQLSEKDKIFYHQHVAKRCMNYERDTDALKHYRRLVKLQGVRFKTVSNMLRIKFRLIRNAFNFIH